MDARAAEKLLSDVELIPYLEASFDYAKEIRDVLLEADVPAMLYRADSDPRKVRGPRMQVLVREEDLPRVAEVLHSRWREMAEREGMVFMQAQTKTHEQAQAQPEGTPDEPAAGDDAPLPCPACGTAAALVDGACPECGLQLE